MATVLNTLYPPLIDTFMPAFLKEGPAMATFSISPFNNKNDITRIHVSLVSQLSNINAFAKNNTAAGVDSLSSDIVVGELIDGIYILPFNSTGVTQKDDGTFTLKIPSQLLRLRVKDGEQKAFGIYGYYKLQLRFDSSNADLDTNYLTSQRANFSEWSSVSLLKAIPTPDIELNLKEKDDSEKNIFNSGTIAITGKMTFDGNLSGSREETMRSYSIKIYNADDPTEIIDSVGPVYTYQSANPNNIYWLAGCEDAKPGEKYAVNITATTKNQYEISKEYEFEIYNYDELDPEPQWEFKKRYLQYWNEITTEEHQQQGELLTEEDGAVEFTVKIPQTMAPGYLYIKRASSLDKYKKWELISCTEEKGNVSRTVKDITVGSLVDYRYSVQFQPKKGIWTNVYTTEKKQKIYPKFHDMLLSRQGRQLAIRYDGQITNLKPVVNRQKIDTLGGKYPKFAENAQMNYKQFSISGLIDAESDFNRFFLDDRDYTGRNSKYGDIMGDYNAEMDGKYQIRNDTAADREFAYPNSMDTRITRVSKHTIHDIYPVNNWWLEREFREQAVQWLNDGEPKLFRSMTEGNMAVMLTDISLTPNRILGRRLYNFTATMYEVGDGYSLDSLGSLGIVDIIDERQEEEIETSDLDSFLHQAVGQIYSFNFPKGTRKGASVINGSMVGDTSNQRGFDYKYISIEDLYNFIVYEKDSVDGKQESLELNSFKLTDVKIQFESNPRWYNLNGNNIDLVDVEDFTDSNSKNLQLGYKIGLKTQWQQGSFIPIFINKKGYYQTPTNLKITDLRIYDNAKATIDYKVEYKTKYNDNETPSTVALAKKLVAQVSGPWSYGTYLSDIIKKKHYYVEYDAENKIIRDEQLTNWHAVSFELTPYTLLDIKFKGEKNFTQHIVGRTGIYNLVDNYPIDEVAIKGKRMVRVEKEQQKFLDDWEFVLDDSAILDESKGNLYNLTWKEFVKRKEKDTNTLVEVNGKTTTQEEEGINRLWNNFNDEQIPAIAGYNSIYDIKSPQVNTVYGIRNNNGLKYMIYYQDYGWYEMFFEEGDTTQSIGVAKVPVYGMINYWADIIERTF